MTLDVSYESSAEDSHEKIKPYFLRKIKVNKRAKRP